MPPPIYIGKSFRLSAFYEMWERMVHLRNLEQQAEAAARSIVRRTGGGAQ